MDVKTIREVAEIVKEMGLSVLEADDGKIKIRIEKAQTAVAVQPP